MTTDARHASSMVARGSPSTTSAGSPSPSWQSTESVPRTPFASLAHAYASSLPRRAPPRTAIAPGPWRSRARRNRLAAASRATPHGASLSPSAAPVTRRRGVVSRSSALLASKPKRPLSHSQPWLVGSASTPRWRTRRFDEDCAAMRQPTAHVTQVDSTCSRSQGRARKR